MMRYVLLRHGESTWNEQDRFTGWTDVELTAKGIDEAVEAGRSMRDDGYVFDRVFTSVLRRTIKTAWVVLERMDLMWIPIEADWRLNERHYGALQGFRKAEMIDRYGVEQVSEWRRSYTTQPPRISTDDERYPAKDPKYRKLRPEQVPVGESLKDTFERVVQFWTSVAGTSLYKGERILIVSHGNTLRALVKHLKNLSDDEIEELEIPTGKPLPYE
jgi:2,3-bisphosphoglycerate-dependent phosphoglycerate mutase